MIDLLLFASLVALQGPSPAPSPAASVRNLEYRFAWNAKLSDTGPHTGTLTVALQTPASDGSVAASASELWWNQTRPSDLDACQIDSDSAIVCMQRPYSLSTMDLTLFPLLAPGYFDGLTHGVASTWKKSFQLTRGLSVWDCNFTLSAKGLIPGSAQLDLIEGTGTIVPHGNRYGEETVDVTTRIAYDPVPKLPVLISAELTHNRNRPRSLESVQLELKPSAP